MEKLTAFSYVQMMDCQIFAHGEWVQISLEKALTMHADRTLRCTECHGRVRAHKEGKDGQRAHFEHKSRHPGCSRGNCFSGTSSLHPKAVT